MTLFEQLKNTTKAIIDFYPKELHEKAFIDMKLIGAKYYFMIGSLDEKDSKWLEEKMKKDFDWKIHPFDIFCTWSKECYNMNPYIIFNENDKIFIDPIFTFEIAKRLSKYLKEI